MADHPSRSRTSHTIQVWLRQSCDISCRESDMRPICHKGNVRVHIGDNDPRQCLCDTQVARYLAYFIPIELQSLQTTNLVFPLLLEPTELERKST